MNSVYKKSVPEGVLDAPTSALYSKTPPKGELKSLRNIVAQGNFSNSDHSVFTWTLDDTGLLTIDGKGDMPDWYYTCYAPWYSERDKIFSVQISDGVTSIGEFSFYCCSSLKEILIPDGVTSIGGCAFKHCGLLREIKIPDSVTSILYSVFSYCASLWKIHIPQNVSTLGSLVFSECSSLTRVTMPHRFKRFWCNRYSSFEKTYGIPKSIVTFY